MLSAEALMAYLWAFIGFTVGAIDFGVVLAVVRFVLRDHHREPRYVPPLEKEIRELERREEVREHSLV